MVQAEGALWVGQQEGPSSQQIEPHSGEVPERLDMPPGLIVAGLESDCAARRPAS